MSNRFAAVAAGIVLSLSLTDAGLASGGDSGGGGGVPSDSGPQYDPYVEYQAGATALAAGDYRKAETAFGHVLAVTPQDAASLYMMGLAKRGRNDLKGALRYFERAVKADPAPLAPHRDLATAASMLGQAEKAAAERTLIQSRADACAGTCPQDTELKAALAAIDAAKPGETPTPGKPSADLAPGLLFTPGAGDVAYVQAVSLINEARYPEAMTALRAAETALGPHPDVLTYLGYASRKQGFNTDAEAYYRQALAIAPNHRGALEYYGELKVLTGDRAGARRLLARLDTVCGFGCAEAEDLRRWIDGAAQP